MTRAANFASSYLEAALLLTAVAILVIYLVLVSQSPIPPVEGTTTIGECGPGQNPSTTLCYDPNLPSE